MYVSPVVSVINHNRKTISVGLEKTISVGLEKSRQHHYYLINFFTL